MDFRLFDWHFYLEEPLWCFICLGLFLALLLYDVLAYSYPAFSRKIKPVDPNTVQTPVSIVVVVRNEQDRVMTLLDALLSQTYDAPYEVVVVDKSSIDDTDVQLAARFHDDPRLIVRKLNADTKFGQDNTLALGVGIRAAQYPYVIAMKVETVVDHPLWLATVMHFLPGSKKHVLFCHTAYPQSGAFIRLDLLEQSLAYIAAARKGMAYVSDGGVTLFEKESFYKEHGFNPRITERQQFEQAYSGQLINSGNSRCTLACVHPQATVTSARILSRSEWKVLRLQGLRAIFLTNGWSYFWLTLEKILTLCLYVALGVTTFRFLYPQGFQRQALYPLCGVALLLLFRWVFLWIYRSGYSKRLKEKGLYACLPIWDIVAPFMHIYFLIKVLFSSKR